MSGRERAVSNSIPLIWLAKINRLSILRSVFGEIIVPDEVYYETSSGQSPDCLLIKQAVEEGWIRVSKEKSDDAPALREVSGIHLGEAQAILLAQRMRVELVVDDREASATAQVFGVRCIGTVGVLLLALTENHMTLDEYEECMDLLMGSGFWLTVDVYRKAVEQARSTAGRRTVTP